MYPLRSYLSSSAASEAIQVNIHLNYDGVAKIDSCVVDLSHIFCVSHIAVAVAKEIREVEFFSYEKRDLDSAYGNLV